MDNSIPFYNPEKPEYEYRSDDQAIEQAMEKFTVWEETGAGPFNQDDYAILFQAGVFEYGANAERFCAAVFRNGPVPGERVSHLTGEDVAPRPATGEVDYRGSQRITYKEGGNKPS